MAQNNELFTPQRKDLFDLMMKRVKQTADEHGDKLYQAFARWFSSIYFGDLFITNTNVADGSGDGKADVLVTINKRGGQRYSVINSKFTTSYDSPSPVAFYDEITRFWQAFENKSNREEYLKNAVREPLRKQYKMAFKHYDEGLVELLFITNHKINSKQYECVKNLDVKVLHLDDILQYFQIYMMGGLPETEPLVLSSISNPLAPEPTESEVPTTIVFARLIDFIKYMDEDMFDLLFSLNARLDLGSNQTNKEIKKTFTNSPSEFAYSNNGITLICNSSRYDTATKELIIENPHVVNGSQTLHSIRNTSNPSSVARVMTRIIQIASDSNDLPTERIKKREIIHKISTRTNMQNPIKRWNLVSNDEYQNELSQFFWKKGFFYERRQNEWRQKRDDLRNVGIEFGSEIRWLTQLIASYYYDIGDLGPANAQGRLNYLFEEVPYLQIKQTVPETAYAIHLLGDIMYDKLETLKYKKKYIQDASGYIKFPLFSLICRSINQLKQNCWDDEKFTAFLEKELETPNRKWGIYIKKCIDHILSFYKKAKEEKTMANFFKLKTDVAPILTTSIPKDIQQLSKDIFSF